MSRAKTSSSQVAWSLLIEGVAEARVDLHRLRLMCDRAQSLVEKSEARDHIFQVAGDIVQGFPDRISAAERALDRTSYALSVMGEDFLRGRILFDDRDRVDGALKTSPFASRPKESSPHRVVQRYLQGTPARVAAKFLENLETQVQGGAAPSAESYFFNNPEMKEVRQFQKSDAISNKPGVAVESVKESESPDRTVSEARSEAKKAPPTPAKILEKPGGEEFSTLNRFLILTEQPGVEGVPEHRDELPKHPVLAAQKPIKVFQDEEAGTESRIFDNGSKGYYVALFDVESGNTLPFHMVFKDLEKAIQYAKKIANVR